ncbi:hypothetical protein T440DRAFT_467660 [Plenodomus tracheiphilus IPT5]|uniref:Uncharacterized protein n=1 Tax=Plenodomus tracheiphilus IPT5 TaxID=1408161 RepID=A0A6A7BB24_9PLEO|nr:hypothetical protein T440DRAFT_467660 [Plenodomus tracheiphilus IPT5]
MPSLLGLAYDVAYHSHALVLSLIDCARRTEHLLFNLTVSSSSLPLQSKYLYDFNEPSTKQQSNNRSTNL